MELQSSRRIAAGCLYICDGMWTLCARGGDRGVAAGSGGAGVVERASSGKLMKLTDSSLKSPDRQAFCALALHVITYMGFSPLCALASLMEFFRSGKRMLLIQDRACRLGFSRERTT
ncbi:hypothetical protein HAX54_020474 [Datura stramonium]|uniref:Uncharacterized protein n=1 Tax=Datura stramonium TaxID=4076 RepID=A0ABS8S608_DATST|nr:hypothetical protein [Datura stramonium]